MKHLILVLILGLTNPLSAQDKKQYTAADYYNAGETVLKKGDAAKAEQYYRKTLELDPNHANARFRLASMKDLKPEARIRMRKGLMKKVILPNVAFDEEPLSESLAILGAMIEKESGDALIPNFVVNDPKKVISEKPVTLRLRGIPATVALDYVLGQANARASWGAHGITVTPIGSGGPVAKDGNDAPSDTKETSIFEEVKTCWLRAKL